MVGAANAAVTRSFLLAGSLSGQAVLPAFSVADAATEVTIQADITNHGDGSLITMSMEADVSLDGGASWQVLMTWARDKGYPPITTIITGATIPAETTASATTSLPSTTGRQLRAFLNTSAALAIGSAAAVVQ